MQASEPDWQTDLLELRLGELVGVQVDRRRDDARDALVQDTGEGQQSAAR